MNRGVIFIMMICLAGCAAVSQPRLAQRSLLRLDTVSLDNKQFSPEQGEATTINFTPSQTCQATVTICNSHGLAVRTLLDKEEVAGPYKVAWDGKDSDGDLVSRGLYYYLVELTTADKTYLYNPYHRTHGHILDSVTGAYDKTKGVINYNLPQAAMLRVRVGLKDGGPLLATLRDWTPTLPGEYKLAWDGKDNSGYFDLSGHPKRELVIFAYTLADNSIIVDSKTPSAPKGYDKEALFSPALAQDRSVHARNYLNLAREPGLSVELLGAQAGSQEALVVSGVVPVRVSIDPEDRRVLENSRYEIMFYVDATFLFEDEAGFSPFTYQWDTSHLPEGQHFLTVNLLTYDGNCAVVTKKVVVKKDK